jgi:hypothetical protein
MSNQNNSVSRVDLQPIVRHAEDITGEFTACGWSYDAGSTEDGTPEILMARTGEIVNCAECRRVIDHWRKGFSGRYKSLQNIQSTDSQSSA